MQQARLNGGFVAAPRVPSFCLNSLKAILSLKAMLLFIVGGRRHAFANYEFECGGVPSLFVDDLSRKERQEQFLDAGLDAAESDVGSQVQEVTESSRGWL